MDHILQLNEFFVEGGRQEISHVLLHITEPSTPEEQAKGYFFAICEINNAETKYIAKLQDIIDRAENDYYELPDEIGKTSLELVLEKINQEAHSLIKPESELHCILGTIRQPEIIFTFYGQPELVLFYKNRQGLYQTMDLLESDKEKPDTEPTQMFSQLVQGKISPGDFLFAGTPHIVDYFNHDRLEKIITARPAAQSAEHIERVLADLRDGFSFGGLIIHLRKTEESPNTQRKTRPVSKGDSTKSLHNLFGTERNTANTLSASLLPRLVQGMQTIFKTKTTATETAPPPKESRPSPQISSNHLYQHRAKTATPSTNNDAWSQLKVAQKIILTALRALGKSINWLALALYTITYALLRGCILLIFIASNYQNRRKSILEDWHRQWRGFKENFRQLPAVTKFFVIAALIAGCVFLGSIGYLRYREQKLAAQNAFQAGVQLIRTKKDAIESALVYKDQNTALAEYKTAESALAKLACSAANKATCSTLQGQLAALATRLRKITTALPETLLSTSNQSLEGVIKINTKLITYSSATSTLTIYDTLTKQTTHTATFDIIAGFTSAAVPKENDYALFVFNKKSLLKFDPTTNEAKIADISYPNDKVAITGMGIYNRRLYVLDSASSQIYKHDTTKTGFGPGKEWIKTTNTNTTIGDGTDLTIDGDVYILKNNGQITKFTSGTTQPFSIQGLDPALVGGGKLWTYNDVNYLYVVDGPGKRLLILEKDGRLRQQITAKEFQNPSGLAIDTQNNFAYITDGTKLYKITLSQ